MALQFYGHPFSSYCQKAQIALYENGIDFEYKLVDPENPQVIEDLATLWPMRKFPILVDGDRTILEASIIIEYLHIRFGGPVSLISSDRNIAVEERMLDRVFDNYVMTPMGKLVADSLRPADGRDPPGVAEARASLDTIYAWLNGRMAVREWAAGHHFSLADCAAAPSLFYADWAHPIPAAHAHLHAYRARLLARPSFARAVDEARPFRPYFPLGAPDRD